MAQVPATPKLLRIAIRAAAAAGGARVAGLLPLQASERAALALRRARAGTRPGPAEGVVFLIPLVGRGPVSDWDAVSARLAGTLDSLVAQTDGRWRAIVCCQDRPPLPDDPRIRHLPFDDPTPGNDKWRKLAALCDAIPANAPAFVMSFDADDLLHRDAVRTMLSRPEAGGHLVVRGLVMDHATGVVAQADRASMAQPLRKPFWKLCGSCAALHHDPAIPEGAAFLRAMTAHEHRMFPYLARLAGLALRPLPFAAVLYVLNHGENFGARRGRVGFKTRFVERFRLTPDAARRLLADFPAR